MYCIYSPFQASAGCLAPCVAAQQSRPSKCTLHAAQVTVTFNADVSDGMNWRFVPTQRAVKVGRAIIPPIPCFMGVSWSW